MPGNSAEYMKRYREKRKAAAQEKKEKMAAEFSSPKSSTDHADHADHADRSTPSLMKRKRGVDLSPVLSPPERGSVPDLSNDWMDLVQALSQKQRDELLTGINGGKRMM